MPMIYNPQQNKEFSGVKCHLQLTTVALRDNDGFMLALALAERVYTINMYMRMLLTLIFFSEVIFAFLCSNLHLMFRTKD